MSDQQALIRKRMADEGAKSAAFFRTLTPEQFAQQVYTTGPKWRVRDVLARKVSDVMTTPVVSADPVTDIRRIAWVMLEHQVDGVPIVNETQVLVGFVSRSDILRPPRICSSQQWLLESAALNHLSNSRSTQRCRCADSPTQWPRGKPRGP